MTSRYIEANSGSDSYEVSSRTVTSDRRDLPRMNISRRMAKEDYSTQASGAIFLGVGILVGFILRHIVEEW